MKWKPTKPKRSQAALEKKIADLEILVESQDRIIGLMKKKEDTFAEALQIWCREAYDDMVPQQWDQSPSAKALFRHYSRIGDVVHVLKGKEQK